MGNWSGLLWTLLWAGFFLVTVVGSCRAVGSHALRTAAERAAVPAAPAGPDVRA
jgi:hypothetical protein